MTELEQKTAFAKQLLRTPNDPYRAALAVFPDRKLAGKAMQVAQEWTYDEEVLAIKEQLLIENGGDSFLPSKEEFCAVLWEKMTKSSVDMGDFVKAGKLYADVRGFIEKDNKLDVNVNNNRVMFVTDNGSNDDWEKKLLAQQTKLLNDSQ